MAVHHAGSRGPASLGRRLALASIEAVGLLEAGLPLLLQAARQGFPEGKWRRRAQQYL